MSTCPKKWEFLFKVGLELELCSISPVLEKFESSDEWIYLSFLKPRHPYSLFDAKRHTLVKRGGYVA